MVVFLIFTGCIRPSTISPNAITETANAEQPNMSRTAEAILQENDKPPIAIVSLVNQTLKFNCLNEGPCIQDIYLGGQSFLGEHHELGSVYYVSHSNIYLMLFNSQVAPWKWDIIHINLKTGEIGQVILPEEIDDPVHTIAHGHLVLAERGKNKLHIINNDLTTTDLEFAAFPIYQLIEVVNNKILLLNSRPLEENGNAFFEFIAVDVNSGESIKNHQPISGFGVPGYTNKSEPGSKQIVRVEGVSVDLENIYLIFGIEGSQSGYLLGSFNVKRNELIGSITGHINGYHQYRNTLFSSNTSSSFGNEPATLVDMKSMVPLTDSGVAGIPTKGKLLIVPFGNYFLLGTDNEVILMDLDGNIVNIYPLPGNWRNKIYQLMIYRN